MISRCPFAEWVPWGYGPLPTYYRGLNKPAACVIHISQGYIGTARQWAAENHFGASWGFAIGTDGEILQHLERTDGGYHAGIPDTAPKPKWRLWRGHGQNVNHYTDSIELMGFYTNYPYPPAQMASLKRLCQWLAETGGYPYDRDHFPAHGDIDIVNRFNDFARPADREAIYRYLFAEEEDMTPDQTRALIEEVIADKLYWSKLIDSSQIPSLVAQLVDAIPSTFTEAEQVRLQGLIRDKLA